MVWKRKRVGGLTAGLAVLLFSMGLQAENASDILERVVMQSFGEDFRTILSIKTFKGPMPLSSHVVWVMGQNRPEMTTIFMAFEEPEEQKGLRYLFQIQRGKEINGFMYDPSLKKTVPVRQDDPSADLGGSGLIMDDIRGFVPKPGETEALLRHEKIRDRQCSVIFVSRPREKAGRKVWVDPKNNVVVKMQTLDPEGSVVRELNVIKFFRDESGQEFPREEEINIPDRNILIRLRQEAGLLRVEIPPEVMDPEQFGTYKWIL